MAYNSLSQSTLTAEERVAEKDRLVRILGGMSDELNRKELEFVAEMELANECSIKQLLWLRDINAKY